MIRLIITPLVNFLNDIKKGAIKLLFIIELTP